MRHKAVERVPYAELIYEASELKILHYKDMEENATFNRMIISLAADCRSKCMKLPCNFKVSFTEGQDFFYTTRSSVYGPFVYANCTRAYYNNCTMGIASRFSFVLEQLFWDLVWNFSYVSKPFKTN